MQFLIIFAILFAIGGVLFALQNNAPVVVSFIAWEFHGSLALVLLLTLALGMIIAALVSAPATVRMKWRIRRQQGHIDRLEKNRSELEARVQDLERRVPPVSMETPEGEVLPYVGLRQMMSGPEPAQNAAGEEDRSGDGKGV